MATRRTTKRKTNTALVHNPSRGLSLGSGRRSPVRKAARRNPARKSAALKANPSRRRRVVRRSNPATFGGLLVASVMAGLGVSLFDVVTSKLLPQGSPLVRIGVKAGGAYLLQSKLGSSIPVLGKYKNEIALVLGVSAVVDAMKLWVLPVVTQAFGNVTNLLVAAPAAAQVSDGNVAGLYDVNGAYQPIYA